MDNILFQDNKSAIPLERNGKALSSKRMKQIEIRHYFVTSWIFKGGLIVEWCPTKKIVSEIMTKLLQGKVFL